MIDESLGSEDEGMRKVGVKLLGAICESNACLDPIKDNIDYHIDQILAAMTDRSFSVRCASSETVAFFA